MSRIETGARVPSLQVIRALAERLGVSEDWLARGDDAGGTEDGQLRDADLALRLDDLAEAESVYERLYAETRSPPVRAVAAAGLGQIAFRHDDPATAVALLEEAFALDREIVDPAAAETLGRSYALLNREEEAIGLFRRYLTDAEARGDAVERLRFSVLLANAQIDAGLFAEAAGVIGQAIASADTTDMLALARLYWTQSRFHTLRSEPEAAAQHARKALALLEAGEHTLYQARAYQLLAHIELDAGNPDEALTLIEQGRARLGTLGTPHDEAKFAIEEARARAALGHLEQAAAIAMNTAGFAHGHPVDRGRCYSELAAIFAQQGDHERADELYELAIEALSTVPSRYLVETYARYGALLEHRGQERKALEMYKLASGVRLETPRPASS